MERIRLIATDGSEEFTPLADLDGGLYTFAHDGSYAYGPLGFTEYQTYADESLENYERPEEGEYVGLVRDGELTKRFEQHWDSDGRAIWPEITHEEIRPPRPECEACQGTGKWVRSGITGEPVTCTVQGRQLVESLAKS